ncbi:hypothetical protein GCM10025789_28730 [Tessaracoccus lubricantis]|uniref:Beta-hexosaminidase bacterial type N-terminal domain-containing protein n=1 Tax=Tessaracoccus lubricantis TaxID=545543 RepID=A0ABP9FM34_9ACTN
MISILPEPKHLIHHDGSTRAFTHLRLTADDVDALTPDEVRDLAVLRFHNYPGIFADAPDAFPVHVHQGSIEDAAVNLAKPEMFAEQGYVLDIRDDGVRLSAQARDGLINGLTSLKQLLAEREVHGDNPPGTLSLPTCLMVDYPSIPVRAVAPTFSWYAGYGRIGFDMQLWGYDEWELFLHQCVDQKINQLNMVMYGYWPFEFPEYPETSFTDIPVEVWNQENGRFIKVKYSHPNVADNYLPRFIELAHRMGVKIMAYVGLNSYNGGWTIAHPEKRMIPPAGSDFLNDFDSVCLSDKESVNYILTAMRRIAELGFDGYTLEESEEGFWFCTCERCTERWGQHADTPGEAKHQANLELLMKIREEVRQVNPDIIIGIRAFRQPPLEKDPAWLQATADALPDDIVLFWAPALYVPPTEFQKWVKAFGKHRIWARDTESNSITSTMGRLYRTFESNMIRYGDEPNVQVIERDIEQHIGSVEADVHGINGYIFEWFGLFLHLFAHGNYGWGSRLEQDEFFARVGTTTFGPALGARVLRVMREILTIHESQIPLYTTPFPFQSNKMTDADIPRIEQAVANHEPLLTEIRAIRAELQVNPRLKVWSKHFDRLENAERRNRVIYDLVLAALAYEREREPEKRDLLLDEVLHLNERDFDIAKEMFFDLMPVGWTGVRSCMMPYHEMKRLIHNLRHPEDTDNDIICSGIEALGWLWLSDKDAS